MLVQDVSVDSLRRLVASAESLSDLTNSLEKMEGVSRARDRCPFSFQSGHYSIAVHEMSFSERYIQNLEYVMKLGIGCAPFSANRIKSGSEFDLIVVDWSCNYSDLQPYNSLSDVLDRSLVDDLVSDINLLTQSGLYNPNMLHGTVNWLVDERSSRIFVDNWERLEKFEENNVLADLASPHVRSILFPN